jgi:predicted phage tail protein
MVAKVDGTVVTRAVASVDGPKVSVSELFTPLIDSRTDLIDDWGDFDGLPLVGGAFIYNDNSMAATTWRVLSVQEQNGTEYAITAISYNASKYDYIERGKNLVRKTYLPLTIAKPADPQNVTTEVASYEENGQLANTLYVNWQNDPTAVQYEVRYRLVS